MAKLTFKKIAELTLEKTGKALSVEEIWHEANRLNIVGDFKSSGKTPWATIGAYIYWSLKEPDTPFVQVSKKPALFGHKKYFTDSSKPKFYIIGSKYLDKHTGKYNPVLESMIERSSVSVGFAYHLDLSEFYRKPEEEIRDFLYSQGENKTSVIVLKKFLQLKSGDLIAIKSHGRYSKLEIIAYARVTEDSNNMIYKWDKDGLGHLIHVEFLETGISRKLNLNKGLTCHEITDPEQIRTVFGWYTIDRYETSNVTKAFPTRSGTASKNLAGHFRKGVAEMFVKAVHNQMQQRFYDYLNKKYPGKAIMEKNFVDIIVEKDDEVLLYEVKVYSDPVKCVTEALGQSLSYYVRNYPKKKKKVIIVGPYKPTKEQARIINAMFRLITISISYIHLS